MPATPSAFETIPTFADLTTIRIGGPIDEFVRPETRDEVIDTVRRADAQGTRLCIIGGGSNMLVSDAPFHGVVVRDMRNGIRVSRSAPGDSGDVIVEADAGANWDDFVAWTVSEGYEGIEGLSGIPGSVGASVVQNIGAYGQEVASSVLSVTAWDRQAGAIVEIGHDNLAFGYRFSALKATMYETPEVQGTGEGRRETRWFPSPRYVVLAVTYRFRRSRQGTVGMGQLAKALGVEKGTRMDLTDIRAAVLSIRATKDMLEDPTRYANPWMAGTKREIPEAGEPNHNRWSCGSFFINPVVTAEHARRYLDGAPQYPGVLPDGTPGVKTSAAWLIDHAGFHKGFRLPGVAADSADGAEPSSAGLSTVHTLALTNRGGATFDDVWRLASCIRRGVDDAYHIDLVPEPVVIR